MNKIFVLTGAIFGAMSVACGAFGAHALRDRVTRGVLEPRLLEVWETAAQYQMYHALGLVAAGLLGHHLATSGETPAAIGVTGWAFVAGVALFSGSLYTMTLTGVRWLGAITPLGGVAFIVGWIALAVAASNLQG